MIEVIHADVLSMSPEDFESFDVQITDFPYSPHVHENPTSVGSDAGAGGGMGVHARPFGFEPLSEELRFFGACVAQSVKRWSVMFSDLEGTHGWRADCTAAGAEYVREVPWIRWSQPQLSGDRPCSGAEALLFFHRGNPGPRGGWKPLSKHWNGPGSLTHFSRRCMRGQDKHPAEKPIDLMLDLVSYFSDPGETVVDLCGGAGTTAVAARLLGRDCVAFERDATWAASAARRANGALSGRDIERAKEWCITVEAEASAVPFPRAPDKSDVKTWERAQRRLADVERVMGRL
jgi:hypothetical protein